MTDEGVSSPRLRGDFADEITEIGTSDTAAQQFAAAISDDLAQFVENLTGVGDGHVADYAAQRGELSPVLLGIARAVAEGSTLMTLTLSDSGPDLAITRRAGCLDVTIRILPDAGRSHAATGDA